MKGKWNKDRKRTIVGNYVMIGNFCDWKYMHLLFFLTFFWILNISFLITLGNISFNSISFN